MLRLLTALMICVLVFSHGTMGVAAPHADHSQHAHVSHHDETGPADIDHHDEAEELRADTADDDSAAGDATAPEAAHAHAAADQVPSSISLPDRLLSEMQLTGLIVTPLRSAPQSPLLEPPSA